ncbi:sulfur carrier protein ThiS [Hymenobacter wooponensis]|uniref:Sulfur carrier protein ThiS n=1 Tax=Hymenobacter wooponensis TaxID=1525360 RepID=A0A4Z0MK60_9BACT|nr:sulfur carrier protein ThiS [Hymenobacter wooponensis]TGD79678.1 sulfur carrier protein ThiS [Hymenobacter wooponensis]
MIYYVNNTPQEAAEIRTVAEVMTDLQLAGKRGLAVAVNDTVVAQPEWASYTLQSNDRVTIIRATQGG